MIIRTYMCKDCEQEFEVTCESNDGDPDCPNCARVLDWQPGMFAITGNKAKAVDITQKILEQDYGLSNFKDNNREGDVGVITPPEASTSEREKVLRTLSEAAQATGAPSLNSEQAAMAAPFWGGAPAPGATPMISREQLLAGAAQSTALADAEGVNPIALLHKAKPKMRIDVVARAKM